MQHSALEDLAITVQRSRGLKHRAAACRIISPWRHNDKRAHEATNHKARDLSCHNFCSAVDGSVLSSFCRLCAAPQAFGPFGPPSPPPSFLESVGSSMVPPETSLLLPSSELAGAEGSRCDWPVSGTEATFVLLLRPLASAFPWVFTFPAAGAFRPLVSAFA